MKTEIPPSPPFAKGGAKAWWKSRILWLNVSAAGLVALEASTGLLQPLLPVDLYTAVAVALPAVNAMLRVVTTQALTVRENV